MVAMLCVSGAIPLPSCALPEALIYSRRGPSSPCFSSGFPGCKPKLLSRELLKCKTAMGLLPTSSDPGLPILAPELRTAEGGRCSEAGDHWGPKPGQGEPRSCSVSGVPVEGGREEG